MLSVCTRHPQPAQNLRRRQSRPSIRIPRPTPVPKIAAQLIEILGCLNGSRVRCSRPEIAASGSHELQRLAEPVRALEELSVGRRQPAAKTCFGYEELCLGYAR